MPAVSFILPTYILNGDVLELTYSAIHSFKEAEPDAELIIIDDGSPTGSGYLRAVADTYIWHKENQGFIRAINAGLRLARGNYLVCCNNDIRIPPNAISVATGILERHSDVLSVHPRMLSYEEPFSFGKDTWLTGKERWCQTSFFIIRNNPPLFDENFQGKGGAYEDWHFWHSIRKKGLKTAYTNKTCFQHKDSSTTKLLGEKNKFTDENREYFKKKHGEYPEELYQRLYPEQFKEPWRPFP